MTAGNDSVKGGDSSEILHSDFPSYVNWSVDELINNGTSASTHRKPLTPEAIQQMILLGDFMVVALTGNSIVLIHLIRNKGWMRPVSIFVMSLAISKSKVNFLPLSLVRYNVVIQ